MKIEHDSENKTVKIDDAIPQQFQLIYILLFLNLVNSGVNLYANIRDNHFGFFTYLWFGLALVSIGGLWFYFTKRSIKKQYDTDSILHIQRRSMGRNHRYRLVLHNGKVRELITLVGEEEETEEFEKIWSDIGIPIVIHD